MIDSTRLGKLAEQKLHHDHLPYSTIMHEFQHYQMHTQLHVVCIQYHIHDKAPLNMPHPGTCLHQADSEPFSLQIIRSPTVPSAPQGAHRQVDCCTRKSRLASHYLQSATVRAPWVRVETLSPHRALHQQPNQCCGLTSLAIAIDDDNAIRPSLLGIS
jgi:hypothetical protein